ncbi:molybdate ABC transporter permease subunit [bacterium]|nr:MAG: molybdate ABC transporter permease subunit [bacterium]
MRRGSLGAILLAVPLILLLVLPIVALLLRAPIAAPSGDALEAVWVSLRTSTLAAAAILLFGTPLALLLARRHLPAKGVLEVLVILPAVLPPAAAGLALLLALGRRGVFGEPLQGLGIALPFTASAVVLAQMYVAAPFFVRPLASAFRALPADLEEAALIDGAGASALFWRIALPLVRRPLIAALTLAWARALGEFGATALFAGSRVGVTQTLPLAVYLGFETDIDVAASLSLLLLAVAVAVIGATLLLQRREEA